MFLPNTPTVQSTAPTAVDPSAIDMSDPAAVQAALQAMPAGVNAQYMSLLNAALRPASYEADRARYEQRLASVYQEPQRPTFFQLMSDLGAGILSQPVDAGPYTGMAAGFKTFSDRMAVDRAERRKLRQQVALQAAQMALEDERAAEKRISDFATFLIKNQGFGDVDLITLRGPEMDDTGKPTGRTITRSLDKKSDGAEIKKLLGQGFVNVADLPDQFEEGELSKLDAKAVVADATEVTKEGETAIGALANLDQAEAIAQQLGPEGFGAGQQLSLPFRQFFGPMLPWLGVDLEKVSLQEALATVTIGFTLANVAKTKGAVSNSEMELFKESAPFLGQTYEGFMRSIAIQRKAANKKKEFAREYQAEYGRISKQAAEQGRQLTGSEVKVAMDAWKAKWQADNRDSFLSEDDKKFLAQARKAQEAKGFSFDDRPFDARFNNYLRQQAEINQRMVSTEESLEERIARALEVGTITQEEADKLREGLKRQ